MADVIDLTRGALHDQVAAAAAHRCWSKGRIAPGAKLNERELCELLHVSRTPLREAIKRLAAEGLVDLLPNRGAVAVRLTDADVVHTFEVLAGLEGLSGELAAAAPPTPRSPRSAPCTTRCWPAMRGATCRATTA
jgi:DNA-binding GntR family transcriptional regulator